MSFSYINHKIRRDLTLRISVRSIAPIFLGIVFLAIATIKGFAIFKDSYTYLGGYPAPVMSQMAALHPVSTSIIAIVNFRLILYFYRRVDIFYKLVLLNPYSLALVFTLTKEQILFTVIFLSGYIFLTVRKFSVLKNYLLMSLHIVRPAYIALHAALYIMTNKSIRVMIVISFVGFLAIFIGLYANMKVVVEIYDILQHRSIVNHTGRDYFNYLCVSEKSSFGSFFWCWLKTYMLFPIHKDMVSLNYFIFLTFQIPILAITLHLIKSISHALLGRKSLRSSDLLDMNLLLGFILLNFLIFWWSPTFGAYQRYFLPVVWIFVLWNAIENFKGLRRK